jgi:hypothetical protein
MSLSSLDVLEMKDSNNQPDSFTMCMEVPFCEKKLNESAKQRIKKIVYILIVYCWLPILLLVMSLMYNNQIKFIPSKPDFMTINTWMQVHSTLGLLDALLIILIVIYNGPSAWDGLRFLWFFIYVCRLISFIFGSFIFWKQYNNHDLEPYAVKVIIWIALIVGWVVFLTQGCCSCKINQCYACSNDVLDII